MLRLAAVFIVWIASTAQAFDDTDMNHDVELRALLTNTNGRTILPHVRADRSESELRQDER
jgi:hypothetical protein